MEESGAPFDERCPVDSGLHWLGETFGSRPPSRRVRASPRGLAVDGMDFLPRERITRAFFLPRGPRDARVVVHHGLRRMTIEVLSRDEGMRLLRALRLDHRHATLEMRSRARLPFFWIPIFFAMWLAGRVAGGGFFTSGAPFFFAAALYVAFARLFAARVVVGADGVTIHRGFLARFFPFAEMRRAWLRSLPSRHRRRRASGLTTFDPPMSFDHWLVLETSGREEPFAYDMGKGDPSRDDLTGLVDWIETARLSFHGSEPSAVAEAALARNDRPAREWAASLKGLAAGDHRIYRVAPIESHTLFEVLEDPARAASARLAAAVALGASLDEAGRARMKDVASGVAEPKLRVALEKVAAGTDDDETTELLQEIDAQGRERG